MSEENYQENLRNARRESTPVSKSAQNMANSISNATSLAKTGLSMLKQIRITDFLFILPFMLAILKDISDTVLIGSMPGIGTTISICCSIFGGLYIWMIGASDAKKKARGLFSGMMQRFLVLLGGTMIEGFGFGINFLPIETLTFTIMYLMLLYERSQSSEQEQAIKQYA